MLKRILLVVFLSAIAAFFYFKDDVIALLAPSGSPDSAASFGASGTASPRRYGTVESTAADSATAGSSADLPRGLPPRPGGAGPSTSPGTAGDVAVPSPPTSTRPPPAPPDAPEAVVAEAKGFIAQLTRASSVPISVTKADHFVTQDQVISLLPDNLVETTTVAAIEADPALSADSPITVVKRIEQIQPTSPADLISTAAGNLTQPVKVFEDAKIREVEVRELLERFSNNPDVTIAIVKSVPYYEVTTPAELAADANLEPGTAIEIIKTPYALESATVAELIRARREVAPDTIFYIRTVRATDQQGIWGIVQDSLTENFGRGVAIGRGERNKTYQINIPREADEMLDSRQSSFLGRLIHRKAKASYVYSFKDNRMGQNPDRIYPGQEIVIIDFQPEELISIYRHFVEAGN